MFVKLHIAIFYFMSTLFYSVTITKRLLLYESNKWKWIAVCKINHSNMTYWINDRSNMPFYLYCRSCYCIIVYILLYIYIYTCYCTVLSAIWDILPEILISCNLLHELLRDRNNSKLWETRKIFANIARGNV